MSGAPAPPHSRRATTDTAQSSNASHHGNINNTTTTTNMTQNSRNKAASAQHPKQGYNSSPVKIPSNVVQPKLPYKQIASITFQSLTPAQIRKLSHIQLVNRDMYDTSSNSKFSDSLGMGGGLGQPMPYGVLDKRLGTSMKKERCGTCGLGVLECVGHWGFVKLELPLFHFGYFKSTLEILQTICKRCSHILLSPEKIELYLSKMRDPNLELLPRKALTKEIRETCKKAKECPHCHFLAGPVKKIGPIKIEHEIYRSRSLRTDEYADQFKQDVEEAKRHNGEISEERAQQELNPLKSLALFKNIPDEHCELLDMNPNITRPEQLIATHIIVPPKSIRPTVVSDRGNNEDDLTVIMARIIQNNELLKQAIEAGNTIDNLIEIWNLMQTEYARYINSDLPGFPPSMKDNKPTRSFVQRLKGKQGRFRGNLSGKRVDFSARTVISPDPNLKLWEIAVPVFVAKRMSYPEAVTDFNIERLRNMVRNGPEQHPGAHYIIKPSGFKISLKFIPENEDAGSKVEIGDIVERHVIDNDVVLFNRQPSLHRLSIMAHRVKVLPYRTFRFNVCACNPYNADFDGDEMNLHLPQTEEARTESWMLMGVVRNMITPRNGEPIVAPIQDFITASYLLTRKNMFFDRGEFCELIAHMGMDVERIDLPPPAVLKPIEYWTGKQLFSMLIKPNDKTKVFVNLRAKGKNYVRDEEFCPHDGFVSIINSELISGQLDKKILGSGAKNSLFYILMKHYGNFYAAECMSRVAKLSARFMGNWGFSIGISDVTPDRVLIDKKAKLLEQGFAVCDDYIKQYKAGKLEPQPGCNELQTLEAILNRELSSLRQQAGEVCIETLHWQNAALIMAQSGSKGSTINISQMVAMVGQQTVGGGRIAEGFVNRTLPHFKLFERSPQAKGFVSNSFFTGLTPTEFIFHTMGGREGLVDTAVKTAETGYMQRRLVKALEDLFIAYDGTVRNSVGGIVQVVYGDDGLDPIKMRGDDGRPVDFAVSLLHIQNTNPCKGEKSIHEDEIRGAVTTFLRVNGKMFSELFRKELRQFIDNLCERHSQLLNPIRRHIEEQDSEEEKEIWRGMIDKSHRITKSQLVRFLRWITQQHKEAATEAGEAAGAIAAQSIGEPGTQMTLKTFHFAGVASMNITLGVPRIIEIINATRNIKTPIISAQLVNRTSETAARIVKGRVERTSLGQICEFIHEVYDIGVCYFHVKLDKKLINSMQLELTDESVREAILGAKEMKSLDDSMVKIVEAGEFRVYPFQVDRENRYYCMQYIKTHLPGILVSGIPSITRAVITKKQTNQSEVEMLAEGTNLLYVMGIPGVDGAHTKSNNILEIEETLGIEAARSTIMNEIHYTMKNYGMSIDFRHMMLLGDVMTYKGEVMGITRHGIAKMKDSVLVLASFEKTPDHLFDAGVHSRTDYIQGVSECIIMGVPIGLGTGLTQLIQDVDTQIDPPKKPLFL